MDEDIDDASDNSDEDYGFQGNEDDSDDFVEEKPAKAKRSVKGRAAKPASARGNFSKILIDIQLS